MVECNNLVEVLDVKLGWHLEQALQWMVVLKVKLPIA
jgi:hypothetical protein